MLAVPVSVTAEPRAIHEGIRGALAPAERVPSTTGFESLFIGHSFFVPVVRELPFHASTAGFGDHSQSTVFSGGPTGAPKALWDNPTKRAQIQAVLDSGDVEMVGMTYHPDHPTLEGYRHWIDDALSHNGSTRFFVGFPWLPDPRLFDARSYRSTWADAYDSTAKTIIDDLRTEYPGVEIFAVPYGQAAAELIELFEDGNLPDVDSLVSRDGAGIFRDGGGHADEILRDLASLVFLRAIYGVELAEYDYDPGYLIDLKAIGDSIMSAHDPRYNIS